MIGDKNVMARLIILTVCLTWLVQRQWGTICRLPLSFKPRTDTIFMNSQSTDTRAMFLEFFLEKRKNCGREGSYHSVFQKVHNI